MEVTNENKVKRYPSKNTIVKPTEDSLLLRSALIDLSYEPIFVWDMDAGITEWNEGAVMLYGFNRKEAKGKRSHNLLQTIHPLPFEVYLDDLEASGFWSGELRHKTKDGREVVVESRQQLVESNGRRLVLECNRDITARKLTEGISDRYRVLSEQSSDVIWFIRPDGGFMDVNRAAVETYGFTREEFLKMNIRDVRHPSTLMDFQEQFDSANLDGIHFETLHVRKNGMPLPVEVNANGADFGGERLVMAIVRDISERKMAEAALRESEERRQLAQEAGNVGIFDWDIIADKTYWSETMWAFYGEEPNNINPDEKFWSAHLHTNDRERVKLNIHHVVEAGENRFHDEFRIVRSDGSVRWIEATARVSREAAGNALRMYGVNIDVTTRKEAEERLRLSENQLRLATNAVPALISYVDKDERYRFANQQFTEWFDLELKDVIGAKVCDVVGKKAYRIIKTNIARALAGDECTLETVIQYEKAGSRYVHATYVPDVGVDGAVHGYFGLTHDLTDLRRSQDLLRSSEERIGMMMESFQDYAIFSMDSEGRIDSWNKGAEIIFGYEQTEILGKPYEILFSAEDVERAVPVNERRTARLKGSASDDRWQIRKDKTRFFSNGVMMPIKVGEELTGYAKIVSDLTEKQRRADELQRAHDELEIRVEARTKQLEESNLALIQEMNEREVAERQRFELLRRLVSSQEFERRRIARDIHDQLGQRLTALRLKIASLKESAADSPEFALRVERIQEIAERLDSEVSFLAWELRPTALDDLGLVDAIGAFVNEWSRHYEIPADFHSALLSNERLNHETETHLYRITQEALNNIAKHAQADHVTVLLEKREECLILIVEDNGKGFIPSDESLSGESGGGLGLIGMRERAMLVGGEIEIESAPGKGTTIYVRVPV